MTNQWWEMPEGFSPFPPTTVNPDSRFCSDKSLWDVYKASLLLERRLERRRCQEFIRAAMAHVPEHVKPFLEDLARQLEWKLA